MAELTTASPAPAPHADRDSCPGPTPFLPSGVSSAKQRLPPPSSFPPRSDSRPSTAPVPPPSQAQQPPQPPSGENDEHSIPPELDDGTFVTEVLHLEDGTTEEQLDEQLQERAKAMGVELDRPEPESHVFASGALSTVTVATPAHHTRSSSTTSNGSISTALTTHSSTAVSTPATAPSTAIGSTITPLARKRSKSLSFSHYDRYLAEVDPNITQPKIQAPRPSIDSSHSFFGHNYKGFKLGLKVGWKKRSSHEVEPTITCICCREDFQIDKTHQLRILPCGHTYCSSCLHVMITQATVEETKMPPRCCTQPIPSSVIKAVLSKEEQQIFLKAVIQFSTPWESRIFCPNRACGEFIPLRKHVDPKHPFEVTCQQCRRSVCVMCKRSAHPLGQDCPDDWELDTVLKMGEKSGWRRCYKCRNLVELSVGCTHMTCRCKAQFCYICGAIWDPVVGCPNFCNGEEELDRRRREEEERMAAAEAETALREAEAAAELVERAKAEERTRGCAHFTSMLGRQRKELDRFVTYEKTVRWKIWLRHADQKKALADKYQDLAEKMRERHAKTAAHLEDRQVAAEMELRNTLEHQEKSVRIRLKHMEAYCDAEGTSPDSELPPRVVTERDRRELGQQYNIRDGMERLHQAKINVMRDRQAKRMEELLERQEVELEKLTERQEEEVEDLAAEFAHEEDAIVRCIDERKSRMLRRWRLALDILCAELEDETGLRYATPPIPEWPTAKQVVEYKLPPVVE